MTRILRPLAIFGLLAFLFPIGCNRMDSTNASPTAGLTTGPVHNDPDMEPEIPRAPVVIASAPDVPITAPNAHEPPEVQTLPAPAPRRPNAPLDSDAATAPDAPVWERPPAIDPKMIPVPQPEPPPAIAPQQTTQLTAACEPKPGGADCSVAVPAPSDATGSIAPNPRSIPAWLQHLAIALFLLAALGFLVRQFRQSA